MLAVSVEDLNALIAAIGHVDATAAVGFDPVQSAELPVLLAARAPRLDELAGLVEFHHARVAKTVRDQNRSVGQPREILRLAEMLLVVAGHVLFAERHHQLLPVVGEFVDLLA